MAYTRLEDELLKVVKRAEQVLAHVQYPSPLPPSNEIISKIRHELLNVIKKAEER